MGGVAGSFLIFGEASIGFRIMLPYYKTRCKSKWNVKWKTEVARDEWGENLVILFGGTGVSPVRMLLTAPCIEARIGWQESLLAISQAPTRKGQ